MTNHFNPLPIVLVCLLTARVLAIPAEPFFTDEAITLPGGQKVIQCYGVATQTVSQMFMCLDVAMKPLLLTISSVKKFGESTALPRALSGKFSLSLPLEHREPSFLRSCKPRRSTNHIDEFECVHDQNSVRVGIRNHVWNKYQWVEVMVDSGEEAANEAALRRDAKSANAAPEDKKETPADRADCADEHDPNCDLEEVRAGDN